MKLTSTFGSIVHLSYEDACRNGEELKKLLYESKILVLRGLGELDYDQLWDLHANFGTPWSEADYEASIKEKLSKKSDHKVVAHFGKDSYNRLVKEQGLPWHRDIPWHTQLRYPIRSLYALNNSKTPTLFSDANVLLNDAWTEEALLATEIRIQYWYSRQFPHGNYREKFIPLIERHPFTGQQSVLMNSFGLFEMQQPIVRHQSSFNGAWIMGARRDGRDLPDQEYLHHFSNLVDRIETQSQVYSHDWKKYDLLLFDNYSGVWHKRGILHEDDVVRSFLRMNLRHSWQTQEQPIEIMK